MSERDWLEDIEKRRLTRRNFVKGSIAGAGALSIGGLLAACGGDEDASAPAADGSAEKFTGTLRVTGLGVDLIDPIKAAAEAALGFSLAFDVTDTVTGRNKVVTQPRSLDIFSGYFNDIDQIWPSGNMVPIPIDQIERWDQLTGLYKVGKIEANEGNASCQLGDGDAPFRKMYVTESGELTTWADPGSGEVSGDEPGFVNLVGGNFNMDSMGYNGDVIQKEPNEVNWDELLNPEWRGRVAVLNDPSIGMQDVANAAVQAGLMEFADLGNMTQDEIDGLIKLLLDQKKKGQFRAFWTTFDESVTLMQSGEVVIESMWSPAVALLQSSGHPTRYAAPSGGFRGWAGGMGIMNHVADDASKYQACIDYINWWHGGEAGAIMMRQGYYNVVQETSRDFVEPFEWDYWIDGKPAAEPIPNPFGQETAGIPVGSVRDGGSFQQRACVYSSWNSLMDEQQFQVQRWNEFLAA